MNNELTFMDDYWIGQLAEPTWKSLSLSRSWKEYPSTTRRRGTGGSAREVHIGDEWMDVCVNVLHTIESPSLRRVGTNNAVCYT